MSARQPGATRLRRLSREVAEFAAVGGIGVLVNLVVFNLVRNSTELPVVRCSMIATAVAIIFNYIGFRYFTYRDRDKTRPPREFTLFLVFSAAGLVIENGLLYVATYGFDWDTPLQNNIFKFLGIGVASLFRFWSYRSWVFRAVPAARPAAAPADAGEAGDIAVAPEVRIPGGRRKPREAKEPEEPGEPGEPEEPEAQEEAVAARR
ncbi:GtrA family protein [Streptomyces sp. NBC_01808]|uniref:GtrA family protein n=1 Tax=Streptomyces sp. NBC_01808 TaxID=2975947 RepID=UPI002DD98923|nr:GtrA family protein [Streptomyces sp. NBC_01808]WSA38169.1 GtrA family protein [Streptomyces sp. NBC_01808]